MLPRGILYFVVSRKQLRVFAEDWTSKSLEWLPTVADSKGEGRPPPLTGCILKQTKILHDNALFLHKNFKHFLRRGPHPLPFRPLSYSKFLDLPLTTDELVAVAEPWLTVGLVIKRQQNNLSSNRSLMKYWNSCNTKFSKFTCVNLLTLVDF